MSEKKKRKMSGKDVSINWSCLFYEYSLGVMHQFVVPPPIWDKSTPMYKSYCLDIK